ncbi:MAG: hypothetical protein AAF550_00685 [Myxococcota bacterium]
MLTGLCGCFETEYPGESVETFLVDAELTKNECGNQAVPATVSYEFRVELRREESIAYWRRPDSPLVTGTVDEDTYEFRFIQQLPVYGPEETIGLLGCTLVQDEQIDVGVSYSEEVDAGTIGDAETAVADAKSVLFIADATNQDAATTFAPSPESLEGTNVVEFSPTSGSDCGPTLVSAGGPFLQLPCTVSYELLGEPTGRF